MILIHPIFFPILGIVSGLGAIWLAYDLHAKERRIQRMRAALEKADRFVSDVVETRHKLAMTWFGNSKLLIGKDAEEALQAIQAALKEGQ